MRPFWMHVGHGFAKIDAIISRFGACGARVAHRSPADVVAQTKGGAAVTTLACLNNNLPSVPEFHQALTSNSKCFYF